MLQIQNSAMLPRRGFKFLNQLTEVRQLDRINMRLSPHEGGCLKNAIKGKLPRTE